MRLCQICKTDLNTTRAMKYCRTCGIKVREQHLANYHKKEKAARKLKGLEEKFYAK